MGADKGTTLNPWRIAVVGGGIAGLSAAYDLTRGRDADRTAADVIVYEAGSRLGGLAAGFKGRPEWDWPLEHFYHHLFTNDDAILEFTREIGLGEKLEIHAPTTSMFYQGRNYAFDSPRRLIRFPHLSLAQKLRMGLALAYLRYHPRPPWQDFDRKLADSWLAEHMGKEAYTALWQPMLQGKFGDHYAQVNLAWFWARIYKRTSRLGYYAGGFQAFVDGLAAAVRNQGVSIATDSPITEISPQADRGVELVVHGERRAYDAVLSTVSPALMQGLTPALPEAYLGQLRRLKSMGAVMLIVALDRRLLEDGTYWVNVPKREGLPFLALVEHTNMIDPVHYAGDHLLYIGNYLDPGHRYFSLSADELLTEFAPHLDRFNHYFHRNWITGAWTHKAVYAQPVPPVCYADMIPAHRTPLAGIYFACMSQVYPWDRGTNYAVESGRRVARMIFEDLAQYST